MPAGKKAPSFCPWRLRFRAKGSCARIGGHALPHAGTRRSWFMQFLWSFWSKYSSCSNNHYQISKSLALANKLWPRVASDVRIAPLLNTIGKQYLGRDYLTTVKASGQVTPDQLDLVRWMSTYMFSCPVTRSAEATPITLPAVIAAVDAALHEPLAFGAQACTPSEALGSTTIRALPEGYWSDPGALPRFLAAGIREANHPGGLPETVSTMLCLQIHVLDHWCSLPEQMNQVLI